MFTISSSTSDNQLAIKGMPTLQRLRGIAECFCGEGQGTELQLLLFSTFGFRHFTWYLLHQHQQPTVITFTDANSPTLRKCGADLVFASNQTAKFRLIVHDLQVTNVSCSVRVRRHHLRNES